MSTSEFSINVDLTSDDEDVTIAIVSFTGGDCDKFEATGTAKRMDPDSFDTNLGDALALGRALKKLGQSLIREAYEEIHEIDHERNRQRLARTEQMMTQQSRKWQFECEFAALIEELHPGTFPGSYREQARTLFESSYDSFGEWRNKEAEMALPENTLRDRLEQMEQIRKNLPA